MKALLTNALSRRQSQERKMLSFGVFLVHNNRVPSRGRDRASGNYFQLHSPQSTTVTNSRSIGQDIYAVTSLVCQKSTSTDVLINNNLHSLQRQQKKARTLLRLHGKHPSDFVRWRKQRGNIRGARDAALTGVFHFSKSFQYNPHIIHYTYEVDSMVLVKDQLKPFGPSLVFWTLSNTKIIPRTCHNSQSSESPILSKCTFR